MRIVCISDTHGFEPEVPDGDILIHAGDMSMSGRKPEIEKFNNWLGTLPHPYKIVIAGNHDFLFERDEERAVRLLTNCIYLRDQSCYVKGLKIYGAPWQPEFCAWAFNVPREEIHKKWALIPNDTDILVTHGPPAGILDKVERGELVGCGALAERLLSVRPKLHVFGHIHESYGTVEHGGIHFANAAICTLSYSPTNKPTVYDAVMEEDKLVIEEVQYD